MKRFLWFLIPSILIMLSLGILLVVYPQQELHLLLNTYHTPYLDIFFKYYTAIGDYLLFAIAICLIFKRVGDSLFLLSSYFAAGLVTQIIKRIVHAPRPAKVFDIVNQPDALPLVEGVKMHFSNSFPSGHTTLFFVLFTGLTIIMLRKLTPADYTRITIPTALISILNFLLATLGGYSRIYLSQHFAADVLAGMAIGVFTTLLMAYGFDKLRNKYPKFYYWHVINLR